MAVNQFSRVRDALLALHDLLDAADDTHWKSWLARDIHEWETSRSTRHHLEAYGGMGSLNDGGIPGSWLNAVFENVKTTCYHLASNPDRDFDIVQLQRSLGAPRTYLNGWKCLSCGYGAATESAVEDFIARPIARQRVLAASPICRLQVMVKDAIETNPTQGVERERVVMKARDSGLVVGIENDWLRPCPQCDGSNTCVYRWVLSKAGTGHFVPSEDNLWW